MRGTAIRRILPRPGPDELRQQARQTFADLARLLAGLARDTASPLIDDLRAECRVLLDWSCGAGPLPTSDMARRCAALLERLSALTATGIPTMDDLRLQAVALQLGWVVADLSDPVSDPGLVSSTS